MNDGTAINYDELLACDGYINVHLSVDDLGTLVAQGDIGQNELTGESVNYNLGAVSDASIFGSAKFAERVNGEILVTIALEGTTVGSAHACPYSHGISCRCSGSHYHFVAGSNRLTGMLAKNVSAFDGPDGLDKGGDAIHYTAMIAIDGYINVHQSMEDLGTFIAQGNVGANPQDNGGEDVVAINYDVTNAGLTAYVFNSDDLANVENPNLNLKRGQTYTFTISASGHPFFIKSVQGNTNADAYIAGVANNGAQDGTLTFEVPIDAPETLFYTCQFHSVMTGVIAIED